MYERTKLIITNEVDENGNPAGGIVKAIGLNIEWQNKPLGRPQSEPSGTFVDDVIEAAKQRIEFYQKASAIRQIV